MTKMRPLDKAKSAFRETANLLALTITAWAAFFSWDGSPWLVVGGLVIEVGFLIWALKSATYEKRMLAMTKRPKAIDLCLLIVTVSGLVIIGFYGFGKRLLTPRLVPLSHAQGWEAAAIWWTALFSIYYLFKFQKTKNPALKQVVFVIVALLLAPLLFGLWLTRELPEWHVLLVLTLGLCFFGLDLFLVMTLVPPEDDDEPNEINLSQASLIVGDIPMVVTFSLLFLYLTIYYDAERRDVFVSGVIACQLLFSNAVFVMTEFGWLQPSLVGGAKENLENHASLETGAEPPAKPLVPVPVNAK